jgi:hypothetical protein
MLSNFAKDPDLLQLPILTQNDAAMPRILLLRLLPPPA